MPAAAADLGADFKQKGDAALRAGDLAEAERLYRQAVSLDPKSARSHFTLGYSLREQGKSAEAIPVLQAALSIAPDLADAHYVLGTIDQEEGRADSAIGHFRRAIDLDPFNTFAHQDLCRAYVLAGRLDLADAVLARGLAHNPDAADLHLLTGNVRDQQSRFREAVDAYDRALHIAPESPEALSNRGQSLMSLARYPEALASFARAQAIRPDYASAHYNEGLCRLLLGEFATGWAKHEWRWRSTSFLATQGSFATRTFATPLWTGQDSIRGKRILLHPEQGLGDTIQFCRYAQSVSSLGATVLLEVQAPLRRLLSDLPGVSRLCTVGETPLEHDLHCPIMSLPMACGTDLDSIPAAEGYLGSSRDHRQRTARWAETLGPRTRPRVGIVWSGSKHHKNDANRSIPLAAYSRILSSEVESICLQNELRDDDRAPLAANPQIRLLCEELGDFSETAALVANLDLVICVDTSVAHLAGALGKPVWVLLPANPDWRWLLQREDTPWYRSMRLFRQDRLGDWEGVLERVRSELDRVVRSHAAF